MSTKRLGPSTVNQQVRLKALLVFSRRHEPFQLFKPIQHDVDPKRCGFLGFLNYQEPPIGCDVIISIVYETLILSFEQFLNVGYPEVRLGLKGCGYHLAIATTTAIE